MAEDEVGGGVEGDKEAAMEEVMAMGVQEEAAVVVVNVEVFGDREATHTIASGIGAASGNGGAVSGNRSAPASGVAGSEWQECLDPTFGISTGVISRTDKDSFCGVAALPALPFAFPSMSRPLFFVGTLFRLACFMLEVGESKSEGSSVELSEKPS